MNLKKLTILLLIILATTVVVSGCVKRSEVTGGQDVANKENIATTTTEIDTSDLPSEDLSQEGWKTYRNEEYGFEFRYPVGWNVTETSQAYWFTVELIGDGSAPKLTISNIPTGFEGAKFLDEVTIDNIVFRRSVDEINYTTIYYLISNGSVVDQYFVYGFRNAVELKIIETIFSTLNFI